MLKYFFSDLFSSIYMSVAYSDYVSSLSLDVLISGLICLCSCPLAKCVLSCPLAKCVYFCPLAKCVYSCLLVAGAGRRHVVSRARGLVWPNLGHTNVTPDMPSACANGLEPFTKHIPALKLHSVRVIPDLL